MIIIFSGYGKGKTSAAAGTALRAWGQGRRVLYIAWLKSSQKSGELKAMQSINSKNWSFYTFGRECPYPDQDCCPGKSECIVLRHNITDKDKNIITNGINRLKHEIENGNWNLIVLDEFLNVFKLFPELQDKLLNLIDSAHAKTDVVITGRDCPDEFKERAEVHTDVKCICHRYSEGITAKRGIDY